MMDLALIASLSTTFSSIAFEALKKAFNDKLIEKDVETIKSTNRDDVVREIREKGKVIQDTSPERTVDSTRRIFEQQLSILEQERQRLVPIATREHMLAFVFVVLAGAIFLLAVIFVAVGITSQAIGTFIASVIPGFISSVFFRREATMEKRLAEITADMRRSEIVRERLSTLEEGLSIVPDENKEELARTFIKKYF